MDFACTSKTCPEQIKALSGVPTPARRAFFGVKHGVAALHGARGKKPRLVWTSVALSVPPITEEPGTLTQYRVPLSVFPGSSRFGNRTQNSRVQSGWCKTEPPARWGSGAHSGRGLMSVWSQTDMRRHCTK